MLNQRILGLTKVFTFEVKMVENYNDCVPTYIRLYNYV